MGCHPAWARVIFVAPDHTPLVMLLAGDKSPDLAVVDGLAWLQLAARRVGGHIRLEHVAEPLDGLLEAAGLLGEVGGKPEGRKEAVGFQEGVDPRDEVS